MIHEEQMTELHDGFINIVKNHPNLHFVILTEDKMYVYSRDTDDFVTTDGKNRVNLFMPHLYRFIPNKRTFILCLISFESLDELLEYISENRYKDDYQKYLENVNRFDTQMQ